MDATVAAIWEKNRKDAYMRSANHLFRSIAENKLEESGFKLYAENPEYTFNTDKRSVIFNKELGNSIIEFKPEPVFDRDSISGNIIIEFKGRIEVHYQKDYSHQNTYVDAPYPISWIEVDGGVVTLNKNLIVLNPEAITIAGDMGQKRVSGMMPLDYLPVQTISTSSKKEISNSERLLEKVYLHTDRNYYYIGEKILFKAYIYYNEPAIRDSLSKVLYVDLIDPANTIIATKKFSIQNGIGIGEIAFGDTIPADNYRLRAYTNWMRNYGDNVFFTKNVPLLDVKERIKND
jgi:hypothetical protein